MENQENYSIIIFGATGDLTKRKLIPGLFKLFIKGMLSKKTPIICVSRRDISTKEFIQLLESDKFVPELKLKANKARFTEFLKQIKYCRLNMESPNIQEFSDFLLLIDKNYGCQGNKIFYLSLSPVLFEPIVKIIEKISRKRHGWRKIVFEKPYGLDFESARKLNKCVSDVFDESEIFRIDHYLGKELVQTILTFRFANSIFENVWNSNFIDHVEITVAEDIGIENRASYYEEMGAIRDMIQNHILQILCLVTMDSPRSMHSEHIRDEKMRIMGSIKNVLQENLVVGQYGAGIVDGKMVSSYRDEKGVSKLSETETFAALKLYIDNKRWREVPFYIRTGKRLAKKYAEVNLVLKDVSTKLFKSQEKYLGHNVITIRIQPDEGIAITFNAKYPGSKMKLHPVVMDFCHSCLFGANTPEAYEFLFSEIIEGDQTLFTRWDWLEKSWIFTDDLLKKAKSMKKNFPNYKAGTMGPAETNKLIENESHNWIYSRNTATTRMNTN